MTPEAPHAKDGQPESYKAPSRFDTTERRVIAFRRSLGEGETNMCIFCGGACGGAGDLLLPSIATAGSLAVMKIRIIRHKAGPEAEEMTPQGAPDGPQPNQVERADASE